MSNLSKAGKRGSKMRRQISPRTSGGGGTGSAAGATQELDLASIAERAYELGSNMK